MKRTGKICGTVVYPAVAFSLTTQAQLAAKPHISPTKNGQRVLLHQSVSHRTDHCCFCFPRPLEDAIKIVLPLKSKTWSSLACTPDNKKYVLTNYAYAFEFTGAHCWSNESGYALSNLLLTQNVDLTVDDGCTESVLRVLHRCPLSPLILTGVILQQFVA